jgi:hypothetical protein
VSCPFDYHRTGNKKRPMVNCHRAVSEKRITQDKHLRHLEKSSEADDGIMSERIAKTQLGQ